MLIYDSYHGKFTKVIIFRRIKKWIYEKQQKSGQTGRRQRYKSLGELEGSKPNADPGVNGNSGAKSKKHSFSTALQVKLSTGFKSTVYQKIITIVNS